LHIVVTFAFFEQISNYKKCLTVLGAARRRETVHSSSPLQPWAFHINGSSLWKIIL